MTKRVIFMLVTGILAFSMCLIPASSEGAVSTQAADTQWTFSFELYDYEEIVEMDPDSALPADAQPIDPTALREGQDIVVALRYSGFQNVSSGGIQCMAVSFCYDSSKLLLYDFDSLEEADAAVWETDDFSDAFIPDELRNGYTASASVRTEEAGINRIYLQYIAEGERGSGTVLNRSEAYVGAFHFMVTDAIAAEDEVFLTWSDHAVSLYNPGSTTVYSNYAKSAMLTSLERFAAPEDVQLVTVEVEEPEGVTVSGSVRSARPVEGVTIQLYQNDEVKFTGTIESDASLSGIQTQRFSVPNVDPGVYKLVVKKNYNLSYTKKSISVGEEGLNLDDILGTISLISGDLNNDGLINISDLTTLLDTANYGNANPAVPGADLNGDGLRNISDLTLLLSTDVYGQTDGKQTFD